MIPAFDLSGVLPPFTGSSPTVSTDASPYQATMVEVVDRFGISPERLEILGGLLRYRADLRAAGLVAAFQWLDGSFVENIEASESRSPNDIDVVTFYRRPVADDQWTTWFRVNGQLFDHRFTKTTYMCDAYGVDLGIQPEKVVQHTTYWFGLFSHRRMSGLWKGMVQVQLDSADDADALAMLRRLTP
ncbi:MAG: hypothetical protein H7840_09870 [Alphaproteobacteria bacterium]